MKDEERIAYKYLIEQGFNSIKYEPNGISTAPDFMLKNDIGVEVRRLNKNIKINNEIKPIEDTTYKFIPKLDKILKK